MKQLPLAPLGTPDTFGWYADEPVLFDGAGLPCTLADLSTALLQLAEHRDALRTAVADLDASLGMRRAWIAELRRMGARDGD